MPTRTILLFVIVILWGFGRESSALAQTVGVTPDEIQWEHSGGLGVSARLFGDPGKDGPYVVRIKVPPNDVTPPHTHRQAESITVISGAIGFGLGTVFDRSKGRMLTAGSFLHLPPNTAHFAWTEAEGAVIQAHGSGPFP
jgi:quercetin dioxygenase-like cupin family protein